ncbi:MAG: class I SAM-dependent methyltransferase [Actinomycetota bacterium]|nr:class I SAM-dependent methyltransferase [Actinomycetota bacterium]
MNTDTVEPTLAARHRAMWAAGDYPAIVADVVAPLGPVLVEATGIAAGDRVLDVAAGTGSVAIPAALTGASVIASDLTPELLVAGRAVAEQRGATLRWREADAEHLPFADGEFDVVVSSIGVMFAPHHQAAADELVRVCRQGGRIGVISWTPTGFIGQMFATMKPYVAAPPPGVSPPPLWGDEDHLRTLLGDRVDVTARRAELAVTHFPTGAAFRDYFKANYGPTITAYRNIAGDPERVAALDAELADLGDRALAGSAATPTMQWEYLLVSGRKR